MMPFSFCFYCEAVIRKNSGLCLRCQLELDQKVVAGRNSQCRFLFDWKKDRTPYISQLIQSLKGGAPSQAWFWLAETFVKSHTRDIMNILQGSVLVPVPSKRGLEKDHADRWAQALSSATGLPVVRGKNFSMSSRPQKALSRPGRLQLEMRGYLPLPAECKRVLIVDDILTTGATASALRHVIDSQREHEGLPSLRHEIWVVAYRNQI